VRRTRGPAPGRTRPASRRAAVVAIGAVGLAMALVACGASGRDVVAGAWNGGPVSAGARAQRGNCFVNGTGAPCAPDGPVIGGCPVFPADNPWNTDITNFPVSSRSAAYLQRIAQVGGSLLHPDFGSNPSYGIPYVVVPANQPLVPITYNAYGPQSDPGPFPIPLNAPVEGGSDRHVLTVQQGSCQLYELFAASRSGAGWVAGSGAKFDLNSNALRPAGWTSADAAGLPILPGLVRYDEVAAGRIAHALRVTFAQTQAGYISPARHLASSSTDVNLPPMGLRLRLRAGYDISGFTGESRVVLEALRHYGMLVADNGSNWYITGATDPRWNDDDLDQLKSVPASAFEVVETGPVVH
jgi:hypothetical protein